MSSLGFHGVSYISTVDFPGTIATTLFVPGCLWDCVYCSNKASLRDSGFRMSFHESREFLLQRSSFIDSVVFSGGEPLLYPELLSLAIYCKSLGLLVGMHTTGFDLKALEGYRGILDYIALDIKACKDSYNFIVRSPFLPTVWDSGVFQLIREFPLFEVRTTASPSFLGLSDLEEIAKGLASNGFKNWFLQAAVGFPFYQEDLSHLKQYIPNVQIRTLKYSSGI